MSGFHDRDGVFHAENVSLERIADEVGTPLYVYSSAKILGNFEELRTAFQETAPPEEQPLIAFACKANSNVAVMKILGKAGAGADVVSGGELKRALAAGIHGSKIIFSGVGKTDEEIRLALAHEILQLNVESGPELEAIARIAADTGRTARVAIRVNPDVEAGTHAKITTGKEDNKFGVPPAQALALYTWAAQQKNVKPVGFSLHIGSQLTRLEPFSEAFIKLRDLAKRAREMGLAVETLDLGGGLGIVYRDEDAPDLKAYAALVRDIIHPLGVRVILEPGRLLTGNAGVLVSRVIYVKETDSRHYLILDAGMNDLIRPTLYEAWHTVRPVRPRAGPERPYDIVGPVCETGDTFATLRPLQEMEPGDLAAILCSGAYGATMSSCYNTRALAPEVLVQDGRFAVIRRRMEVQDILELETVPEWV